MDVHMLQQELLNISMCKDRHCVELYNHDKRIYARHYIQ